MYVCFEPAASDVITYFIWLWKAPSLYFSVFFTLREAAPGAAELWLQSWLVNMARSHLPADRSWPAVVCDITASLSITVSLAVTRSLYSPLSLIWEVSTITRTALQPPGLLVSALNQRLDQLSTAISDFCRRHNQPVMSANNLKLKVQKRRNEKWQVRNQVCEYIKMLDYFLTSRGGSPPLQCSWGLLYFFLLTFYCYRAEMHHSMVTYTHQCKYSCYVLMYMYVFVHYRQ